MWPFWINYDSFEHVPAELFTKIYGLETFTTFTMIHGWVIRSCDHTKIKKSYRLKHTRIIHPIGMQDQMNTVWTTCRQQGYINIYNGKKREFTQDQTFYLMWKWNGSTYK